MLYLTKNHRVEETVIWCGQMLPIIPISTLTDRGTFLVFGAPNFRLSGTQSAGQYSHAFLYTAAEIETASTTITNVKYYMD